MNQIVVDDVVSDQFRALVQACEVFDKDGNKLGVFRPLADIESYEGFECPLSEDELDRIEKEGGGRPLADIVRDLESRA